MSACKLGTTPVNRLTQEQCTYMIVKIAMIADGYRNRKKDDMCEYYISVGKRLAQYKDNLKHRNLK